MRNVRETDEAFVLLSPMRWFVATLMGTFAIGAILGVVLMPFSALSVVLVPSGVVFGLLTWRAASASIRCDSSGVQSTDIDRGRRKVSWAEVEAFEDRDFGGMGVRRTDGSFLPLMQYSTLGDLTEGKAVALLNQQRDRFAPAGVEMQESDKDH